MPTDTLAGRYAVYYAAKPHSESGYTTERITGSGRVSISSHGKLMKFSSWK